MFLTFHKCTHLKCLFQVDVEGIASPIRFGDEVSPLHPVYDIVNLKEHGWEKVLQFGSFCETATVAHQLVTSFA